MEHRHLNNAMHLCEIDQHRNPNCITAEWSFLHGGRAIAPENVSFVYPTENVPSRLCPATQQNIAGSPMEHSSLSFRAQDSQVHAHHSTPSYDSFLPFPGVGTLNANDTSHNHSIHHDRFAVCEVEDGLHDYGMNTGRGQFKRKSHISLSCKRGSTSRFYSAGSSSNSFTYHLDKPASDYTNYPPATNGLSQYSGANLSIRNEDPTRNVRSRSRIDSECNPMTTHLSSYSSHGYHPAAHPLSDSSRANFTCFSAGTTTCNQNNIGVSPSANRRLAISGNTGLRHETNQYYVGGSAAEYSGYRHEPVSSAQYFHSLHDQAAMEVHGNYSQRAAPSYIACARSSHWPQETAATATGLPFISEAYSSRFSRPFSARSWCNYHRGTGARIAAERFQSFSNPVNTHYRMESEALVLEEHSISYGSRNYFDEYRDMRLDVDNMSYEELLALGEKIGHVNTGLSEDVMSECLKETIYSSDKNQKEANCVICLEEYKHDDRMGAISCGHNSHVHCIKRWLAMKNACPICNAPALSHISKQEI